MEEVTKLSATELAIRYRDGSVKPSQVVDGLLDDIAMRDQEVGAFLDVFVEEARAAALEADKRYAAGEALGPLDGIPVAVKDNMLVHGKFARAASKILEGYVASYDATVVDRLKKGGAIILGKTNMDEFAMGSSTEHSAYGLTRNPLDPDRVPGGSSGGSAAAVAAGFTPLALGSDTGGSVRQPAAFCGVVGMKPTYGRVSRSGLIAMASSLDQIGPFARTVEDAELLFDEIQGFDEKDATTHQGQATSDKRQEGIAGLRVGLPKEYFAGGLDPRIKQAVDDAANVFEKAGAKLQEVTLPHTHAALPVYYVLMPAEVSANLARFDGVRYPNSTFDPEASRPEQSRRIPGDFWDIYSTTRQQFFGAETKRRVLLGTFVLSAGYADRYYAKAQRVRSLIKQDFDRAFEDVDVLLTPTAPTLPFRFGEKTDDPVAMYLADIYTVSANLAGIPGISVPFGGISESGKTFPAGVQIMAKPFGEATMFAAAKALEAPTNNEQPLQ